MKQLRSSQIGMLLCGCGLLIMMAFSACGVAANTNGPSSEGAVTPGPATSTSTAPSTNGASTNAAIEPGSIDFIGKVQGSSANSMNLSMPNGDTLTVAISATTNRSDLATLPAQGQYVKVKALANTDGSFSAAKLGQVDNEDMQNTIKLNTVDFQAMTTAAVSGDNVVHFSVGHKNFAATIGTTTQVKNFANAQAIGSNQSIKIDVQFNGVNATVLKVDNGND
jgi:hypothetical protein